MRPLNRITPALPAQAFKTYQLYAPRNTHRRRATCEEAGCLPHRQGWVTTILRANDPGGRLEYTVRTSGRRYVEERVEGGVRFTFPAGQPCFKSSTHTLPLERDPQFLVRGGDWRGNPTGMRRQHTRAELWVEDFAEHQDRIARTREKG